MISGCHASCDSSSKINIFLKQEELKVGGCRVLVKERNKAKITFENKAG
jgi:hypothetical protein